MPKMTIGIRILFACLGALDAYGYGYTVYRAIHQDYGDAVWWGGGSVALTCLLVRDWRRQVARTDGDRAPSVPDGTGNQGEP
jgi:hypothetical protein